MRYIDLHQDLVLHIDECDPPTQTDASMVRKNVEILVSSVFAPPGTGVTEIERQIDRYRQLSREDGFRLLTSIRDLEDLDRDREAGLVLHIEGIDCISSDNIGLLDRWYERGVRSLGLMWNNKNSIGTPASSGDQKTGLTAFGRKLVKRADSLGFYIDCAHLNDQGTRDVLSLVSRPACISHTASRALCDNPRNVSLDVAQEVVRRGGVVGVFFSPRFVVETDRPTVIDVVKVIKYLVTDLGINNVAIGSDFGGISGVPIDGLNCVANMEDLSTALISSGFDEKDVKRIFRLNAYRFLTNYFNSL